VGTGSALSRAPCPDEVDEGVRDSADADPVMVATVGAEATIGATATGTANAGMGGGKGGVDVVPAAITQGVGETEGSKVTEDAAPVAGVVVPKPPLSPGERRCGASGTFGGEEGAEGAVDEREGQDERERLVLLNNFCFSPQSGSANESVRASHSCLRFPACAQLLWAERAQT